MSNDCKNCFDSCRGKYCASKVPIFQNLDCNELKEIVSKINHKVFKKGDVIFGEGSLGNSMFFVNQGKVKLYKYTKEGKEQILNILSEGDFFGELNLLSSSKHNFNVKALKDAKICVLSNEDMKKIIFDNPIIGIKLLENISDRLSNMGNLAQSLATNDADSRVAYLLYDLANKYGTKKNDSILVEIPISREDMANCVGVTRETLSRKLRKFEEEGLIEVLRVKEILIKNIEEIKELI